MVSGLHMSSARSRDELAQLMNGEGNVWSGKGSDKGDDRPTDDKL